MFLAQVPFAMATWEGSLDRSIAFFRPSTPACIQIAEFHSRSISNIYGSLLSAVALSLNIPLQGLLFGLPLAQGSLFGLPMAMRYANHCYSYLPVYPIICMRFAWFECREWSTDFDRRMQKGISSGGLVHIG